MVFRSISLLVVISLLPASLCAREAPETALDGDQIATACHVLEELAELAVKESSVTKLGVVINAFRLLKEHAPDPKSIERCEEYFRELQEDNATALGTSPAGSLQSPATGGTSDQQTGPPSSGGFKHNQPDWLNGGGTGHLPTDLSTLLRDKGITAGELLKALEKGALREYEDFGVVTGGDFDPVATPGGSGALGPVGSGPGLAGGPAGGASASGSGGASGGGGGGGGGAGGL